MSRPSVFIGSSSEGLSIAQNIRSQLKNDAEITIWHEGIFGLGQGTLEGLVRALDDFDFAILVLTPDDMTQSRQQTTQSPRDNVLFECGLFMGKLGRYRTFVVYDTDSQIKIPSDLAGITVATYKGKRKDGNLLAAVGEACDPIRNEIKKQGALIKRIPSENVARPRNAIYKISNVEEAINNTRLGWTLCFIGEDQSDKLATLTEDLRASFSTTGDGKQFASGFSYWGIGPTLAWRDACNDPLYIVMKKGIENFSRMWGVTEPKLTDETYHYVSLGVGTGHKDYFILKDLHRRNPELFYFPLDMSPEMLRLGIQEAVKGIPLEKKKLLPIQIDFSIETNVEEVRRILDRILGKQPILFSVLGNTLSNFENDTDLLRILAKLIKPQDRLLLELARTNETGEQVQKEAMEEYARSRQFKKFVTSALLQNTDLPVDRNSIDFDVSAEGEDRAIRIKAIYRNTTGKMIEMMLPDNKTVEFPPQDTIRLLIMRKYTRSGIDRLLEDTGFLSIYRTETSLAYGHRAAKFGIELQLLKAIG